MNPVWLNAQEEFESWFTGKLRYVFQFEDARQVMGALKTKKVIVQAHPSDYIVTDNGVTFYAEVKSSENPTSFPFANIKTSQWAAAIQVTAAQGLYFFFIRKEPERVWYKVPASVIIDQYRAGIKSIKWSLLTEYLK